MTMQASPFDPARKFVRVTEIRSDGFVAFDFAVGEPELYVEMILTQPAFDEFCRMNKVTRLEPAAPTAENDGFAWRLDQATYRKPR